MLDITPKSVARTLTGHFGNYNNADLDVRVYRTNNLAGTKPVVYIGILAGHSDEPDSEDMLLVTKVDDSFGTNKGSYLALGAVPTTDEVTGDEAEFYLSIWTGVWDELATNWTFDLDDLDDAVGFVNAAVKSAWNGG